MASPMSSESFALSSPLDSNVASILGQTPPGVVHVSAEEDITPGQRDPPQDDGATLDDASTQVEASATEERVHALPQADISGLPLTPVPHSGIAFTSPNMLVPLSTIKASVPTCVDCKLPCNPRAKGVRLRSKLKEEFQCGQCNYVGVCMHRANGEWPSQDFQEFSPDQKVDFYRTEGGAKGLKLKYAETIAANHVERWKSSNHGEFRPMLYWTQIGYDPALIRLHAKPADIDDSDPMAGTQYKVHVKSIDHEKEYFMKKSQILEKFASGKKRCRKAAGLPDDKGSSDSSSDSSTQDDGKKKARKDKKNVSERRRRQPKRKRKKRLSLKNVSVWRKRRHRTKKTRRNLIKCVPLRWGRQNVMPQSCSKKTKRHPCLLHRRC